MCGFLTVKYILYFEDMAKKETLFYGITFFQNKSGGCVKEEKSLLVKSGERGL